MTGLTRRQWALVAAGGGAAAAGVGWRLRRGAEPAATGTSAAAVDDNLVSAGFWDTRFSTPSGATLSPAPFKGRPLLVNFWATWCPPCVKEMPELDRFARAWSSRGWQVLGLAIDQAAPVQAFLQKTPVSFPIALAGLEGMALVRAFGNPSGGLPFTVVISAEGRLTSHKMGATDFAELSAWASQ